MTPAAALALALVLSSGVSRAAAAEDTAEVITDVGAIIEYGERKIMRERDERPFRRMSTREQRAALNQQKQQLRTLWTEYDKVDDRLDALILQLLTVDTPALRTEYERVNAQKRRIRSLIRQTTANVDALEYEFNQAVD